MSDHLLSIKFVETILSGKIEEKKESPDTFYVKILKVVKEEQFNLFKIAGFFYKLKIFDDCYINQQLESDNLPKENDIILIREFDKFCITEELNTPLIFLKNFEIHQPMSSQTNVAAANDCELLDKNIIPIEKMQIGNHIWNIKGFVIRKSFVRSYSNKNGQGKSFNFTLKDSTGCISILAYNTFCDQFYDKIKNCEEYIISNGYVKKNSFDPNIQLDISITDKTIIQHVKQTTAIEFPIIDIDSVLECDINQTFKNDLFAIIIDVNTETVHKDSKTLNKGNLFLMDETNQILLVLWEKDAEVYAQKCNKGQIIKIRNFQLTQFGGIVHIIITSSSPKPIINPKCLESNRLENWFSILYTFKMPETIENVYINKSSIEEIRQNFLKSTKTELYVSNLKAKVNRKEDFTYEGCNNGNCCKKVKKIRDNQYECSSCSKIVDGSVVMHIYKLEISDESASLKNADEKKFQSLNASRNGLFSLKGTKTVNDYGNSINWKVTDFKIDPIDIFKQKTTQ